MTPNTKAQDLIKIFLEKVDDCGSPYPEIHSKECALVCAEQVLSSLSQLPQDDLKVKWEVIWWNKVKEEIQKQ